MSRPYVNTPLPRPPLYDSGYTEILRRVFYQLVRLDLKKNPRLYECPADGVLNLGQRLAIYHGLSWCHGHALAAVHSLAMGGTMAGWRDQLNAVGTGGARYWEYRKEKRRRR